MTDDEINALYQAHSCLLTPAPGYIHDMVRKIVEIERGRCISKVEGNYGWVDGVYFDDLADALKD